MLISRLAGLALVYAAAPAEYEVTMAERGGDGYNYTTNAYVEYAINGIESYTRITSLETPILITASSIKFMRYTAVDWCVDIEYGYEFLAGDIGQGTQYTDWLPVTAPVTFYLAAYAF
jgi:hypothetical protein